MTSIMNRTAGSELTWRRALRLLVAMAVFGLPMACDESTAPKSPDAPAPAVPGEVTALVTMGGKLYVAGGVGSGASRTGYVKTWDGTAWATLPTLDGGVSALAEVSGTLIAGGDFSSAGGVAANHIARWDGTAWSPLGTGTDGPVRTFLVQSSIVLYVGGAFATAGGQEAHGVARWILGQWTGFGQGLEGEVRALAFAYGGLIAGGDFSLRETNIHERNVAQWTGTHWQCLTPGINGAVYAMAVHNGAVVIGGDFRQADWVTPAWHVARLVGTGENWQRVGVGFGSGDSLDVAGVRSLFVEDDGIGLVAGGIFEAADLKPAPCISRWEQGAWSGLSNGMDASVDAIVRYNGVLVAGGRFTHADRHDAPYIATFDGSGWRAP